MRQVIRWQGQGQPFAAGIAERLSPIYACSRDSLTRVVGRGSGCRPSHPYAIQSPRGGVENHRPEPEVLCAAHFGSAWPLARTESAI
jgi:hypothetical protein